MKLYLQMGYGMKQIAKELIKKWGEGTIILSPRDLKRELMYPFAKDIKKMNGNVLFDPQFYLPESDHQKLIEHTYWPNEYRTTNFINNQLTDMLKTILEEYNQKIETSHFIIPGCYSKRIDQEWKDYHGAIIDAVNNMDVDRPTLATICLSSDTLESEEQIHSLIEYVESWDVDGYYVIPQKPNDGYYCEDPVWLVNLLDLCAGLKLQNREVIVGYTNHQELCLSLAKVDAIASGTFMNVRSFPPDKFKEPEEDSTLRKSIWYYVPQALSEFQIRFLDLAQRAGILEQLKTDPAFGSNYADILFSGAKPTDTEFSETSAFRHYLHCLKVQTDLTTRSTYKESVDALNFQLTTASKLLEEYHRKGVRGKHRDFSEVIDTNLSAITLFTDLRGFVMTRTW